MIDNKVWQGSETSHAALPEVCVYLKTPEKYKRSDRPVEMNVAVTEQFCERNPLSAVPLTVLVPHVSVNPMKAVPTGAVAVQE